MNFNIIDARKPPTRNDDGSLRIYVLEPFVLHDCLTVRTGISLQNFNRFVLLGKTKIFCIVTDVTAQTIDLVNCNSEPVEFIRDEPLVDLYPIMYLTVRN